MIRDLTSVSWPHDPVGDCSCCSRLLEAVKRLLENEEFVSRLDREAEELAKPFTVKADAKTLQEPLP